MSYLADFCGVIVLMIKLFSLCSLQMKKMGIYDVLGFPLMDRPDPELLQVAGLQLYYLGALDSQGNVTSVGEQMSRFPLSPFHSRALIAARNELDCAQHVIPIIAVLSSDDVYVQPRSEADIAKASAVHKLWQQPSGDHMTLLNIFRGFKNCQSPMDWTRQNYFNLRSLRNAVQIERQLLELVQLNSRNVDSIQDDTRYNFVKSVDPVPILKSFMAAFYTNLAKKHAQLPRFYHYAVDGNKHSLSLSLHPSSTLLQAEDVTWIMYNDLQYTARAYMRCASKVLFSWTRDIGVDNLLEQCRRQGSVDAGILIGAPESDENALKRKVIEAKPEVPVDPVIDSVANNTDALKQDKFNSAQARYHARQKQKTKK